VEISNSSFVAVQNLTIDSKSIDGVFGISAKNGVVHDILIQNNTLIGQNGGQQTDGISTKVPTWNWVIRHNTIVGAGTGLYLGNSDGSDPFIAGIIENNLIQDTIGYDMEIKFQLPRPSVPGMPTGASTTIIRNNVFIKNDQPSPDGDRPNVLVGGFPDTGPGANDMYEIYGNFFFHNPREALLQASGRVSVHDNIFVDGQYAAAVFQAQDLPLKVAYVYNNTVYSRNRGIFFGTGATVADSVTGNLVFAGTPIGGSIVNSTNNLTDTLGNAVSYVTQPSFTLGSMDFYPLVGKVEGPVLDLSMFVSDPDSTLDFNGVPKNAARQAYVFRGAYAGEGTNPGWTLQAGIKPAGTSAPPALTLQCSPTTLISGQASSCSVSMSPAVSTSTTIALSSNNTALTVPATATMSAGSSSAFFSAISGIVVTAQTAVVTASVNGTIKSTALTINPPGSTSGSAAFVKADTATQGTWKGVYGADGYNVIGDSLKNPAYVSVTPSGNSSYVWANSTSDLRGMQKGTINDRIASCWFSGGSFSVDLNFNDSNTHQVAFYMLDWDNYYGREQRIDILDTTNNVLDTRLVSSFTGGQYLVWNLSGHVVVRITNTNPPSNAVLSGIFFGSGSGGSTPPGTAAAAAFVKADTTTQGTWKGVYGADGYNIIADSLNYPAYVSVTPAGNSSYLWANSTSDLRAMQKGTINDRVAACWFSAGSFTIDLNFNDSNTHQVALYMLDWDNYFGRTQRIDILDINNNVLDTRSIASFTGGQYLVWNLSGHVIVRITNTNASSNAVLSGILWR
jgi:hypothetical protein